MLEEIEISRKRLQDENRSVPSVDCIERINNLVDYDYFFSRFLMDNRPCIISSQATELWPCRRQWASSGAPDFEKLCTLFGEDTVPVADCNRKHYNSQFKDDMRMRNYLDYWIEYRRNNYPGTMPSLYLKDWHCVRRFPNVRVYDVPRYFASDWLNEYYNGHPELNDDYMFVYMGPKGTWTPLHADVFSSYSWSANIVGRKRWLLFPLHEEENLRDTHGQLVYDVESNELNDITKYKMYNHRNVNCFDLIQEVGDIVFIPSGWHHQVWNLEDTISVNHNWINACNILNVWRGIKAELSNVMNEVDDCRDMANWDEHCQLVLKASYGMDFKQFYNFLSFIAQNRISAVVQNDRLISFNKFEFGKNHCLFDLKALEVVLEKFIQHVKSLSIYNFLCKNDEMCILLNEINLVLKSQCYSENTLSPNGEHSVSNKALK